MPQRRRTDDSLHLKLLKMLDSVTTLPFNQHVGIQKSSGSDGLLELPAGQQYLNHIGTVHAGAQLTLAEACSAEFLLRAATQDSGFVPVVRRVDAKFRKPARGRLVATVTTPVSDIEKALAELPGKGRCLLSVSVELHDEHGQHSLSATFEWFIAKPAMQ